MHVLLLPSWYITQDKPVTGVFFNDQAQALRFQGCQVGVVYTEMIPFRSIFKGRHYLKGLFGSKCEVEVGIPTVREYAFKIPYMYELNLVKWHRSIMHLYEEYIRKYSKPDIIHAHSAIRGGSAAAEISRRHGVPYVLTEHSTMFERGLIDPWQKPYIIMALSQASKVYAVSHPLKKIMEKYGYTGNTEVMPNMVDTDYFCLPPNTRTHMKPYRFISIGNLLEKKGFRKLLQSFATEFRSKDNIELVIGGDGEQRQMLTEYAGKLGIDKQVKFLGELSRKQVRDELWRSNVFVLASEVETFGVVLIEAMATGMPVIATRCGGPEDFVSNKVGWLVNKGDVQHMAAAMREAYSESRLCENRAEAIREHVVKAFSSQVIAKRILSQYDEILGSKT